MSKTRKEKIQQIKELFSKLYFFTSEEIDSSMVEVVELPQEGLEKLLNLLLDGEKIQDEYLAYRAENDKAYLENFSQFLKKTTDNLKGSYEKNEHKSAESILGNL